MLTYALMGILVLWLALSTLWGIKYDPDKNSFMSIGDTLFLRGFWCIIVVLVHVPADYHNRIQDMRQHRRGHIPERVGVGDRGHLRGFKLQRPDIARKRPKRRRRGSHNPAAGGSGPGCIVVVSIVTDFVTS